MAISHYKALQLVVLGDILQESPDYYIRKVMRWYSETFSTPLSDVSKLPLDEVFVHYFEWNYERMDEDERAAAIEDVLESEEQRKLREAREGEALASDAEFERQTAEMAKRQELEAPPPQPEVARGAALPEISLAGGRPAPIEPDIKMVFIDEQEMEELLDRDPMSPES